MSPEGQFGLSPDTVRAALMGHVGHAVGLVGSCRLQGIDPHTYLVGVLGRVMDYPAKRVHELTPRAWRQAQGHLEETG